MDTKYYGLMDSPVGELTVEGDGHFLTALHMPNHKHWLGIAETGQQSDDRFAAVFEQLREYFAGDRQEFDVPLRLAGTPFQQQVWKELSRIPFGTTTTYGELAQSIGRPTASRAVGHANGRNPISIIVPCHRVIGSSGELTGYGGGLNSKRWLLQLEQSVTTFSRMKSCCRSATESTRSSRVASIQAQTHCAIAE